MNYSLNIHRIDKKGTTIWNNIHLHRGDYFGVDEKGNLCFTRLEISGNDVKITSKVNGVWVDRFVPIYHQILPIDIQQVLYVNRYMRKKYRWCQKTPAKKEELT